MSIFSGADDYLVVWVSFLVNMQMAIESSLDVKFLLQFIGHDHVASG